MCVREKGPLSNLKKETHTHAQREREKEREMLRSIKRVKRGTNTEKGGGN